MTLPSIGPLGGPAALDRPDLLAAPVARALGAWDGASRVAVVEIDPAMADTAALMSQFGLDMSTGANCVLVAGRRDGAERVAACVVRSDMRADVNNVVRRTLDVRKSSFLARDRAVSESGMEYGGITPIGLPESWPVLVAAEVTSMPVAIIGSGVRRSKLLVRGSDIAALPGVTVVTGLARPAG